jgi:CDP-6-deoxy-D-xylo-4-hexulose-3-dehydrase
MNFWPLQENIITDLDLDVLVNFIRTTKRFTQFKCVRKFENAFSKWQGCNYSIFVNSGSSANLIMISAAKEIYNWKDGDEVIVPSVTWTTTVTPVIQLGLKPIFVDINLHDLSFDYEKINKLISNKTRAIFVAHLLGFPAATDKLKKIIKNKNIILLEDCCETQGGKINGIKVGNFGLAGSFSFYWGHHMTTVEGGMICTNNRSFYELLLLKRSHGLARELPKKIHGKVKKKFKKIDFNFLFLTDGFNVRNTEFQAVLGIEQLKRINRYIKIRNYNYHLFLNECNKYKEYLITINKIGISSFVLPFFFKIKKHKNEFQKIIKKAGIESRPLISGNLLRQPFLSKYFVKGEFENSQFIHENAFYIGNNQFVNRNRLFKLFKLMHKFFNKKSLNDYSKKKV